MASADAWELLSASSNVSTPAAPFPDLLEGGYISSAELLRYLLKCYKKSDTSAGYEHHFLSELGAKGTSYIGEALPTSMKTTFTSTLRLRKKGINNAVDSSSTATPEYLLPVSIVKLILARYLAPFKPKLWLDFEIHLQGTPGSASPSRKGSTSQSKPGLGLSSQNALQKAALYTMLSIFLFFSVLSIAMSLYMVLLATGAGQSDIPSFGDTYVQRVDSLLRLVVNIGSGKGLEQDSSDGQCTSTSMGH